MSLLNFALPHLMMDSISQSETSASYIWRYCVKTASWKSPNSSIGKTVRFICECRSPGCAGFLSSAESDCAIGLRSTEETADSSIPLYVLVQREMEKWGFAVS